MMMHKTTLAALALIVPGPALAELACSFTTECFEAEACQDSSLSLELVDGDPMTIVTEFGDFEVLGFHDDAWLARGAGMTLLLTRGLSGDARASFHLEGPMVTTYLGSCGGEQ